MTIKKIKDMRNSKNIRLLNKYKLLNFISKSADLILIDSIHINISLTIPSQQTENVLGYAKREWISSSWTITAAPAVVCMQWATAPFASGKRNMFICNASRSDAHIQMKILISKNENHSALISTIITQQALMNNRRDQQVTKNTSRVL